MDVKELNRIGEVLNCGGKGGKPGPCKVGGSTQGSTISEGTATVLRNTLVKRYGGRAHKSFGESNPYASHQRMTASIPAANIQKMKSHLEESGWTKDNMGFVAGVDHYKSGKSTVTVSPAKEGSHHVSVTGPKKAKPTTIPYYD